MPRAAQSLQRAMPDSSRTGEAGNTSKAATPRPRNLPAPRLPAQPEINGNNENFNQYPSRNFIKPPPNTLSPRTVARPVTARPGSLAEAVQEAGAGRAGNPAVQRSPKWLCKPSHTTTDFYSSPAKRSDLTQSDLNRKINNTGTGGLGRGRSPRPQPPVVPPVVVLDEEPSEAGTELGLPASLPPHRIGLQNRGNTCYLNASVQALLGLPMVARLAGQTVMPHQETGHPQPAPDTKLVLPFTRLVVAQQVGDPARASQLAAQLKLEMEEVDSQFQGNKQQDASEFLTRFMDELRENIQLLRGGPEVVQPPDLVTSTFQLEREENFVCVDCEAESKVSVQRDLGLYCQLAATPPCHTSLQHLVGAGLGREERERRCEQCGAERATATSRLTRAPQVLLLYLKRYHGAGVKLSRQVEIPSQLSLAGLTAPDCIYPAPALPPAPAPPVTTTPTKPAPPCATPPKPAPTPEMPAKWRDKSEEELSRLGEEEQTEYLLWMSSQQEAGRGAGPASPEEEEASLRAALQASLLDTPQTPVPARGRKRAASGPGDSQPDNKVGRGDWREEYSRPSTREQEEAELLQALELSTQQEEGELASTEEPTLPLPSLEEEEPSGSPEQRYRLASVVSHFGPSTAAGHYVADVFRFDAGGWFRYDDTVVTETDITAVRGGSNRSNGYIFMYIQSPLWDLCNNSTNNNCETSDITSAS